jgi:hypothetical protein
VTFSMPSTRCALVPATEKVSFVVIDAFAESSRPMILRPPGAMSYLRILGLSFSGK